MPSHAFPAFPDGPSPLRRLAPRLAALWAAPLALAALRELAGWPLGWCVAAAAAWSLVEAGIVFHLKAAVSCRPVPFPLRLLAAVFLEAQALWLAKLFGGSQQPGGAEGPEEVAFSTASSDKVSEPLWDALATLSVVLPCANESDFVWRTVQAVFEATPQDQLREILVIDDASVPAIAEDLSPEFLLAHRARVIRHNAPQGLIRTKKHGGDAAEGDAVVFLDCHVKPMEGWTEPILANLRENPRRVVVPSITALDPDTWEEISPYGGGTKMCLTWNADFVWCNTYPGPYVPIMSGGLLAITRFWWETTGGYDEHMLSWGGENLDQSLRTWLCGGEIMVAEGSRVAHMWRDPAKPKTALRYAIPTDHVRRNRLRASQAWLGPWAEKVRGFPEFEDFREGGRLEVGSLANVEHFQKRLGCKGFDSYLERFQDLYLGTGRLPSTTFHLRERLTGLCLQLEPSAGGGSDGSGAQFLLAPCVARMELQRIHGANAVRDGEACCSGLKVWDWDQCLAVYEPGGPLNADACEGAGDVPAQRIRLVDGALVWEDRAACVAPPETAKKAGALGTATEAKKAALRVGCRARVEDDAASGGFRVVIPSEIAGGSRLCLSSPTAGSAEDAHGQAMRFRPCEVAPHASIFVRSLAHGDGRHQISAPFGLCLDAASGQGLISYMCHPAELTDPNQLFAAVDGEPFRWNASVLGSDRDWCVDAEGNDGEEVALAACTTTEEAASAAASGQVPPAAIDEEEAQGKAPKRGQGFERHAGGANDGSFELREVVPSNGKGGAVAGAASRCLTFGVRRGETVPLVATCDGSPEQRWRYRPSAGKGAVGGPLSSEAEDLCIDASGAKPTLFSCILDEEFLSQRFLLRRNGWIEAPRYWADNGRKKLPARCLDSRPLEAVKLAAMVCDSAREAGVAWERLWEETPLETRLFQEARHRRGGGGGGGGGSGPPVVL